jgi:hypothetical protein
VLVYLKMGKLSGAGTVPVLGETSKDVVEDLGNALAEAVHRGLAAVGDRVVALMCGNQGEDLVLQSFSVPKQGRLWSSLPHGTSPPPQRLFSTCYLQNVCEEKEEKSNPKTM